jgi:adenylate kinase family enzyme
MHIYGTEGLVTGYPLIHSSTLNKSQIIMDYPTCSCQARALEKFVMPRSHREKCQVILGLADLSCLKRLGSYEVVTTYARVS